MKNTKKLLVLFAMVVALVAMTLVAVSASEEPVTGNVDAAGNFVWEYADGTLTIKDSATTALTAAGQMNLSFEPAWNTDVSSYPWAAVANDVTELIVEATYCAGSATDFLFAKMPNLEYVRFANNSGAGWAWVTTSMFYNQNIKAVAIGSDPYVDGVWDFSKAGLFNPSWFEGCCKNMTIKLKLPAQGDFGVNNATASNLANFANVWTTSVGTAGTLYRFFSDTTDVILQAVSGTPSATAMGYLATQASSFVNSVTTSTEPTYAGFVDTNNYYIWVLDGSTLTIKDNPDNTTATVARFEFPKATYWPYNPVPTYSSYASRIEEIIVEPTTIQGNLQNYTFAGLANLRRLRLPESWVHSKSSMLTGQNVESIALGSDAYVSGLWDLSTVGLFQAATDPNEAENARSLFYNCCADMDITLKLSPTISVSGETFGNLQGITLAFFSRTTNVTILVDKGSTIEAVKDSLEASMLENFALGLTVPASVTVEINCPTSGNVDANGLFVWEYADGTLTIKDGTATAAAQMNLATAPAWNSAASVYPWGNWADKITEVVIDAVYVSGSSQDYTFAKLPNLEYVRFNNSNGAGWPWIGNNIFYHQNIKAVAIGTNEYVDGVWDFSTSGLFRTAWFEGCCKNMAITVKLPAQSNMNASATSIGNFANPWNSGVGTSGQLSKFFSDTTDVTLQANSGTPSANAIELLAEQGRAFAKSVTTKISYPTVTGYVDTKNYYIWTLEGTTLTITDNPENTTATVARFDFPNTGSWPWNPAPTYAAHSARIEEIVIEPETIQGNLQNYTFANLPNLKRVRLPESWVHAKSSFFYNQKVESVAIGDDPYETGVWDFSNIGLFQYDNGVSDATRGLFNLCCADMSITLKLSPTISVANLQGVSNSFFSRTTNLTVIVDETSPIFEAKATIEAQLADGYAAGGTFPMSVTIKYPMKPANVINMHGYSVRTEGKNGLRGVFSFDLAYFKQMADDGYSVVEFGAIAATEANKGDAVINVADLSVGSKAIKKTAYTSTGGYTTILGKEGDDVYFAVAVVNVPDANVQTNVYMKGYAVLTKGGETTVVYAEDETFGSVNLYLASLEMYKQGLHTSADASISPVYKAINAVPAVTLTKGTDYTVPTYSYTIMGDDTGTATFGDTFEFRNVPTVSQSDSTNTSGTPSTGVVTCTSLGGTLSLYEDANGDYVMIMTGVGQEIPAYGDLLATYQHNYVNYVQYSNYFMYGATQAVGMPNPILTTSLLQKVKTLVLAEGITVLPVGTFTQNRIGMSTEFNLVLPSTINNIGQKAFAWAPFKAVHVNKDGQSALEAGTLDLSNYTGALDTSFLVQGTTTFTKIHLPAHITNYTGESFKNSGSGLSKIWAGNVAEPAAGVADFTAISGLTIGNANLFSGANTSYTPSLTKVKLPAGVTITSTAAAWGGNINTILQQKRDGAITALCAAVSYTYTDFDGNAHSTAPTTDSFTIGGTDISSFKIYAVDNIEESAALQRTVRDNLLMELSIQSGTSAPSGTGYIVLDRQSYAYHDWDMTFENGNLYIRGSYRSFPKAFEAFEAYLDGTNGTTVALTASNNVSGQIPTVTPLVTTAQQLLTIYQHAADTGNTLYGEHWGGGYEFQELVDRLKSRIGTAPATMSYDMIAAYIGRMTRSEISQAICEMLEFTAEGGMITTYCHWQNPNESERTIDGVDTTYRGTIGSKELWHTLFENGTAYNTAWKAQLTFNAEIYQAFKDLGMPVTFRPMIEANLNGSFWWESNLDWKNYSTVFGGDDTSRSEQLVKMYNYVHDYYVNDCGLDNIVWVYSPNADNNDEDSVQLYYPGDNCQIMGMDWYINEDAWAYVQTGEITIGTAGFDALKALSTSKPLGLCEWGVTESLTSTTVPDHDLFTCADTVEFIRLAKATGHKLAFLDSYSGYFGSANWLKGGEALRNADGIILLEDMPAFIAAALG